MLCLSQHFVKDVLLIEMGGAPNELVVRGLITIVKLFQPLINSLTQLKVVIKHEFKKSFQHISFSVFALHNLVDNFISVFLFHQFFHILSFVILEGLEMRVKIIFGVPKKNLLQHGVSLHE